ncbi:MAG: hypothetical protein Q4F34_01165 [Prevotellaceae bacterium]|nr:hypothetical protein [Prevotellaceae bacterium]
METKFIVKFARYMFAVTLSFLCACTNDDDDVNNNTVLHLRHQDWAPDVRAGLNDFMDDCAGMKNAYVVFDFDNTCSIFDIEEQLAIYQLETMSFAMNPDQLAQVLASGLDNAPAECNNWIHDITSAYSHLYDKYGPFTPDGLNEASIETVHADPEWIEFATKMRAMYDRVGEWASIDDSYNWILYWFCGMTEKQVYDIAYESHKKYGAVNTSVETWISPAELTSQVGQVSVSWTRGVQVSENIRELWKCLDKNGIDVWVCSASGIAQIEAAVDAFGLKDYCTGVLAMTISSDNAGIYTNSYDFTSGYAAIPTANGWSKGKLATKAQTAGPGKVTAILNSIAPLYGGATPLAGFMDSTGDFNFCTEFASLRTVVCFNRANRKITDGGGLIAEVAMYEKDNLGYDYASAVKAHDTYYLLQGRDENGLRAFRSSNLTLRFGSNEEKLFANKDNEAQLAEMIQGKLTIKEAINRFSINFLSEYNGYHSR